LETGEVIPPANLMHIPTCTIFTPRPLVPARAPKLLEAPRVAQGPFLFTPIHFGSLDRKPKSPAGKIGKFTMHNIFVNS
jgi:trafficking protein particle complex subunit 9